MLPLLFEGERKKYVGRICATCRKVEWVEDERDADVTCCCSDLDGVYTRWYGRRYYIGDGCLRCNRIDWAHAGKPGAKLHFV